MIDITEIKRLVIQIDKGYRALTGRARIELSDDIKIQDLPQEMIEDLSKMSDMSVAIQKQFEEQIGPPLQQLKEMLDV